MSEEPGALGSNTPAKTITQELTMEQKLWPLKNEIRCLGYSIKYLSTEVAQMGDRIKKLIDMIEELEKK